MLTGMLLIALSCLLRPELSCMFVKLLTPLPPFHVYVVFQAIVVPLKEVREAQDWPEVALEAPHWSRRSEYCPAVTVSH